MILMVDGKEVKVQNDVRIIYEDVIYDIDENEEDVEGQLQVVLTHEGIIADVFDKNGEPTHFTNAWEVGDVINQCTI